MYIYIYPFSIYYILTQFSSLNIYTNIVQYYITIQYSPYLYPL